ncbi:MAG: hypothetical protein AB7V56_11565 [Candidatus Nitrosocosmicus sp.]|nr:hypothetical protein [Candidatus Nitrosocosmicus sp.]
MFSQSSRYSNIDNAVLVIQKKITRNKTKETKIKYKKRRFLPPYSENQQTLRQIQTKEHDRLDNIASEFLGDPELYWQILDTNEGIMHPLDATPKSGRILKIALPSFDLTQHQQ